ncbi:hypothetical protein I204_06314 [Kwoniella mangroviensis CBS 8886]|nr:hypothetical protein I204_06314 [Kwoniella mangroviensis CBS 8886]
MSTSITSFQHPPHNSPDLVEHLEHSHPEAESRIGSASETDSDSRSEASISSFLYLFLLNKRLRFLAPRVIFDDFWWDFWVSARNRKAQFLKDRGFVRYSDDKLEDYLSTTEDELNYASVDQDPEEEAGEEVFEKLRNSGNTLTIQDKRRRIEDWLIRLVEYQRVSGQEEGSQSQSRQTSKTSGKNICQGPKAKTAPISRKRNLDQVDQPISEREERTKIRRR